jgi:membrane protease YdiL (CAAX protease family)
VGKIEPKKIEPKRVVKEEYKIKARFVVKYDVIFLMLMLLMSGGILVLLLAVTNISQRIINIAIAVTLSALIASFMFNYFKEPFKIAYQFKNQQIMIEVIKYTMLGVIVIMINNVIFAKLTTASAYTSGESMIFQTSFVLIQACGEELIFSMFLQSIILANSKKRYHIIVGTIGNGVLFSFYHIFVYQGQFVIFIQLFVFRIILASIYTKTKRISIPMLIHLINNAIPVIILAMEVSA